MRTANNTERVSTMERDNSDSDSHSKPLSRRVAVPVAKVKRLCSAISGTVHYDAFREPASGGAGRPAITPAKREARGALQRGPVSEGVGALMSGGQLHPCAVRC